MAHQMDIDGEEYERELIQALRKSLTEAQMKNEATIDAAVWEKIEEDMAGYIGLMTDRVASYLWAEKCQVKIEIGEMTKTK